MAYPSRGAWTFKNVTQDFQFAPILDSIAIEELHPDGLSTFNCRVRDTGSLFFQNEDRVWVKFAGEKIWAGHVKVRTRTFLDEKSQRIKAWDLQGQDYTSKLEDSVITRRDDRPRESADDRVDFILSHLNFAITTVGVDLPAENVDRANYENMTVREALQQVADELVLHFYVDFGPDDGGPPDLHMFRTETFDSAFNLDVDDPNYTTRFPFSEFTVSGDSQDYKNKVRVRGGRYRRWVTTPAEVDAKGPQETPLTDESLFSLAQIRAAGQRVLDQNDSPEVHGELLCHEPGLRAGMRFGLRLDAWSLDTNYIATQVSISAVDPEDTEGKAYLFSRVSFSDKRRVGRMPGGGRSKGGGSGGNGGSGPGGNGPGDGRHKPARDGGLGCCFEPADMTCHLYESWPEVIGTAGADTVDLGVTDDTDDIWWAGAKPWTNDLSNNANPAIEQDGVSLNATFTGGSATSATFDVIDPDQPNEGIWYFDIETTNIRAGSGVVLALVDAVTDDIISVSVTFTAFASNIKVFYEQQDPANTDDADAEPSFGTFGANTRYSIAWDTSVPGTIRAKVWITGDPEPTTWDVTLDYATAGGMLIPEGDVRLTLAGGGGGTQTILVYPICIAQAPQSGESIKRLQFGTGDDVEVTFPLPFAPTRGSTNFWVDGIETEVASVDYDAPSVTFTSAPSEFARLVYSCVVA